MERESADSTATVSEVESLVYELIGNSIALDSGFALSEDVQLQDIPNMDSLAQVRLVMEIEKLIGGRLSMDEVMALESVGSIRGLLRARGKLRGEP
jgi:acyl carrier protein